MYGPSFKYYRLSWHNANQALTLKTVQALFAGQTEKVAEQLQWRKSDGSKEELPDQSIVYRYELGGYYPVSALQVQFADQNSVARVMIEATNDEKALWQSVQLATFFSVQRDGEVVANLQAHFPKATFRYWRLRLNSSLAGVGSRFPDVSFGWRPTVIRFLARGEGPFTLAYGSTRVSNPPHDDLIPSDWAHDVGVGSLKTKAPIGGPETLAPAAPSTQYPWRKTVLWGILALAVIVLGSMAWQVRKQLPPST